MTVGMLARYYNFPVIAWGTTMPTEIADPIMYPSLAAIAPVNYQLVLNLQPKFLVILRCSTILQNRIKSNRSNKCPFISEVP